MTVEREALTAFMGERWEFFDEFANQADNSLRIASRQLPPEFYSDLREGMMSPLIREDPKAHFRVRLVIDTNIVVMDALRVANGRPSSTERILASPFVDVLAPPQIRDETENALRGKLRGGAKLKAALDHAHRLLSRVKIVSGLSEKILERARKLIGARAPEDVCFLALAMESGAAAVMSRDRVAFEGQTQVRRWDLSKTVRLVVDRESGALSLLIAGTSVEAVGRALAWLFTMMLSALQEIVAAAALLASAILRGSADALAKVPAWVWGIAAGALVAFVVAYVLHEGFRSWVNSTATTAAGFIVSFAKSALLAMSDLFAFLRDLVITVWNLMIPVTAGSVIMCGVLARRIASMLESIEAEIPA